MNVKTRMKHQFSSTCAALWKFAPPRPPALLPTRLTPWHDVMRKSAYSNRIKSNCWACVLHSRFVCLPSEGGIINFPTESSVFTTSVLALVVPACPRDTRWILCKVALSSNVTLNFNWSLGFHNTMCTEFKKPPRGANNGACHDWGQWQITSFQAKETVSVTSLYFSSL